LIQHCGSFFFLFWSRGLSGGSAYTHIADIPSLIVDGFLFGEAFPFSTVHFKRLRAADGTMVTPQDLLTKFFVTIIVTDTKL